MLKGLLGALERGETVITATRRLARTLGREYAAAQQAAGRGAWESPRIVTWPEWVEELWGQRLLAGRDAPVVLGGWQEQVLWERVVRASAGADGLLEPHGTAAAAREAWRLAHEWRLDMAAIRRAGNEDARAFAGWAGRFAALCGEEGWLDRARLADEVKKGIGRLRLPAAVLLAGFDDYPPQQLDLLDALAASGCTVTRTAVEPAGPGAGAVLVPFPDPDRELEAAARWARALLERGAAGRIGVVVHGLAGRRDRVERIFRGVLEPAALIEGDARPSSFNLSAGRPLSSWPLVRSALALLGLTPGDNAWSDISGLLRTPYLEGADREQGARAALDRRLRRRGDFLIAGSSLPALCRREGAGCAVLERLLRKWLDACGASASPRTADEWSRAFSSLLEAFGWPGERPLDSLEFQALDAWSGLLSDFASTGLTGEAMARGEAVAMLGRMAGSLMFQPETEGAPVQVLGLLEASGLSFEHLWVAGLHDGSWPGPANPNPFLPIGLQKEKGMPRCSPERELEFAVRITRRLLGSAADPVFSHPLREGDRELGPSPLVAGVRRAAPEEIGRWAGPSAEEVIRASRVIETLVDETAPPLGEQARQRGGTRVFQLQSACPFRAFAELRLGAEKLESPLPGLDPAARGTLVHAVLEETWRELKTHAALCSRPDIDEVVARSVDGAIARFEHERGHPLPARFAALERQRLRRLAADWLEVDRERESFEVIEPEEEKYAETGGVRFRVKIDRVDRLADGREMIVDYKTGITTPRSWESDRPEEPQLPLYGTIHGKPLAGVLYARVRAGDLRLIGLVDDDVTLPGCEQVDLGAKVERWRAVLARIGGEFREGRAEVDPRDGDRTCRYCPLGTLCRVSECPVVGAGDEGRWPDGQSRN